MKTTNIFGFTSRFSFFSMVFLLSISMGALSSCKEDPIPVEEPVDACQAANDSNEWGYDDFGGPDCWNSVCSHGACTGTSQSPVNITGSVANTSLPLLSVVGSNTNTDIKNNGHTIKFNMDPGNFVSYGTLPNGFSNELTLGQFHFHGNSEHTVDGTRSPLEAHFVHRSIWEDKYLVFSVLFEEGAENTFLKKFDANLPATENATYITDTLSFNPYDLLPANKSYYKYSGSLTTPPCTEVVDWIVFENKVEASATQLAAFNDILDDNFRPIQELNGRTIDYVSQ